MNLSWEREAWKAVRVAEALFELPNVTWLVDVRALELLDPSVAMESLFRQALGSGPAPSSIPSFETEALFDARETTVLSMPLLAQGPHNAPTFRTDRETHTPSVVPVGTTGPVASDDRSVRLHDPNGRERKSALSGQEGFPMACRQDAPAEPTAPHEARLDAGRQGEAEAGFSVPLTERGASPWEMGGLSLAVQAPPGQHGVRHRREDAVWGTAQGMPSPAVSLPDASVSQSTHLVTRLSDLQTLFRSVVADSQSKDAHLASEAPPSMTQARTDDQSAPAKPIRQPSHRDHREPEAHQEHVAGWPGLGRADASVGVFAETHLPFVGGTSPAMPASVWEEILLDQLLDRWEERLREQAIRHLGFTGGLI